MACRWAAPRIPSDLLCARMRGPGTLPLPEWTFKADPSRTITTCNRGDQVSLTSRLNRRCLAVVVVARNAEDRLRATLDSVKPFADELVVVDGGSRDDTRLVATERGAKLLASSWTCDLSDLRNYGWENTTAEWLLWLEPGEVLTPADAEAVRHFVDTKADVTKAYMLIVQQPPDRGDRFGKQIGHVRLVPNYATLRFHGRHGDDLARGLECTGLAVEGIPWRVLRPTEDHEPVVRRKQAQRDLVISRLELESSGASSKLLNRIGESLATVGDHAAASLTFRKSLSLAEPFSTDMLEAYYGLLAAYDYDLAAKVEQIELCLTALASFPCDAQLLCAMGSYLQAQGENELAARAFDTAYRYGQINPAIWHMSNLVETAASCAALAWQVAGKHEIARGVLEDAVQSSIASERIFRQLIDVHIATGRREEALNRAECLVTDGSALLRLRTAVRGACLAAEQQWPQALTYLQMAYGAGCRDVICLRWLTVTLLSTGDVDRGEPILLQWLRYEPDNLEAMKYLQSIQSHRQIPTSRKASPDGQQYRVDTGSPGVPVGAPHHSPLPYTVDASPTVH